MFQSQPCPGVAGAVVGVEAPAAGVVTEASSAWASPTGSSEGPSCKPAPKAAAAEAGFWAVLAAAVTLKASFVVAFLVTVHQNFMDSMSVGQSSSGTPPFATQAFILALSQS